MLYRTCFACSDRPLVTRVWSLSALRFGVFLITTCIPRGDTGWVWALLTFQRLAFKSSKVIGFISSCQSRGVWLFFSFGDTSRHRSGFTKRGDAFKLDDRWLSGGARAFFVTYRKPGLSNESRSDFIKLSLWFWLPTTFSSQHTGFSKPLLAYSLYFYCLIYRSLLSIFPLSIFTPFLSSSYASCAAATPITLLLNTSVLYIEMLLLSFL